MQMNTMLPGSATAGNATQDTIIGELTRRLGEREAEISSITQRNLTLELFAQSAAGNGATLGANAYDTLMVHYMEREEQLRVATQANLAMDNNFQELQKMVVELQNESTKSARANETTALSIARMAKLEEERVAQRNALRNAGKAIREKEAEIDSLKKEKVELAEKARKSEKMVDKLSGEVKSHVDVVIQSRAMAADQIDILQESEKAMSSIVAKNAELEDEIKRLKEKFKDHDHAFNSKDALLNMQRQRMEELENLTLIYEKKFKAKNADLPQVLERIKEGERQWARIEEREKKFEGKEVMLGVLRDDNRNLRAERDKLQIEVDTLNKCFKKRELMLKGTNDKVHMIWLLNQLRDSVELKEKIVHLEEIIENSGWTVKALETEKDFKKKEEDLTLEIERLAQVITILKSQMEGVDDPEVPALIGKLEEALIALGGDESILRPFDDIASQILSAASSDMASLNTNDSMNEEWAKSSCLSPRDLKDFMDPESYAFMSHMTEGFVSLRREGLCSGGHPDDDDDDDDDDEFEDRNDLVENASRADVDDKETAAPAKDEKREGADEESGEDAGEESGEDDMDKSESKRDIHKEKVLEIIAQDDKDPNDWRTWISPPTSPCGTTATCE